MRRADRLVSEPAEIAGILDRCQVLRVAMCSDGVPYVVPVNFGYLREGGDFRFFFHSAREGRKPELLRANPRVCVEADRDCEIVSGDRPCDWTARFESVIAEGVARELTDLAEKRAGMDAIMRHCGYVGELSYDERVLERACVYEIVAETITGKRNSKTQ